MSTESCCEALNVIYSSDDNYAQHLGVSMYSLLKCNQDFSTVSVYVIDNEICQENIQKLNQVVAQFPNAKLIFIPFKSWKDKLKLDMQWNISISSYARLFMASMLPENLEQVLYLDCDTIVCDSLKELWNTKLDGFVLGAVQDNIGNQTKEAVGMSPEKKYFNSGMLLVNLSQWRAFNMESQCLQFIEAHNGSVTHHDQGVLNGLCQNKVRILPLRYNLMTIHFMYTRAQIIRFFGENAQFYSEQEINNAKRAPAILHFTPSFTCRPWVKGCAHPLKSFYWDTLTLTPWTGAKPEKNNTPWHVRLVDWRYRIFPA